MTAPSADNPAALADAQPSGSDAAPARNPIIAALDNLDPTAAEALVDKLAGRVWGFKLNDLIYHPATLGMMQRRRDVRWFVDVKLHDIPNTVGNSVRRLVESVAPDFLTVHASGGEAMMAQAVQVARELSEGRTQVLAVSVLTSMDASTCEGIYRALPGEQVARLAATARDAGCDGLVCSAAELRIVKPLGLTTVVPGIRPTWFASSQAGMVDDQKRVATPREAMRLGADYLVLGRPVTGADDPAAAVEKTAAEASI